MPGDMCWYEVWVKSVITGETERVAVSSSEVPANAESGSASISADGRNVAFVSAASNLVVGDTNGVSDVFVRDRIAGTTKRVSVSESGGQASVGVAEACISENGRYVAFSTAAALVSGDTNGVVDVYVRDLTRGTTTRASLDSNGGQWSDNAVNGISISGDGRYVAFCISVNIDPGPAGYGVDQVFVRDRAVSKTITVSGPTRGLPSADQSSSFPALSADGRYVSFSSGDSALVPGDANGDGDVFVKDLSTGRIELISTDSVGVQIGGFAYSSLSGSGRFVGFATHNLGCFVKDRVTGVTRAVPGSGYDPQLSADGRYMAFSSYATDLVSGDTNEASDIFHFDVSTVADEFVRAPSPDPVVVNPEAPVSGEPVLVLIAGLESKTGGYSVAGGTRSGSPGAPWDYLGTARAARDLGAADVVVIPTAPGSLSWPDSHIDGVLDSTGKLNRNVDELASMLCSTPLASRLSGRPVILIGHSYGGVIARTMLASSILENYGSRTPYIAGLIQFGSPNGGSNLAEWSTQIGIKDSDAVYDITRESMKELNQSDALKSVQVPVVRFGGTYAPDAVTVIQSSLSPVDQYLASQLSFMSEAHSGRPNDGMVAYDSLRTGFGTLDEDDFGGGACLQFILAGHSADMPGVGRTYKIGLWPSTTVSYEELVPQGRSSETYPLLAAYVQNLARRATTGSGSAALQSIEDAVAEVAETSVLNGAFLPQYSLECVDGAATSLSIPLDGPTRFRAASASGSPVLTVLDETGALVVSSSSTGVDEDQGLSVTYCTVDSIEPGEHTVRVSLPAGTSGTVTLTGACSDGAQLALSSVGAGLVSTPIALTAQFASADGSPLTGAVVSGVASLDGQDDVSLAYNDDGTGVDEVAGDGIYSVAFTPPTRGRWLVAVEARHSSAERACTTVVDIGELLATAVGPPVEWTAPGAGGTLASWGLSVPVHVSEEGTYTVAGALTDAAGDPADSVRVTAYLAAGETRTLVVSADAAQFADITPGPLTVAPLLITRYTDGLEMVAGSGPGLTSATSYSVDDFTDFSITLEGPAEDPSPTGAVQFIGTAHNTPSTVASVEYSIDGGVSWQPVGALDGAFDSSHEDFIIDLDLPDYVYGIYVRQTGADGVGLPVGDWAGIRFAVDTVAPAQPADLAAVVEGDSESPLARASWLPSDPPSDTSSLVSYVVALDGEEVGTTSGTDLDVLLPDDGVHTLTVTPVDLAGNTGISSAVQVGASTTPVTLMPVYRFYRPSLGTHFYTADEAEMLRVRNTLGAVYTYEGPAYSLNPANNATPLYRFYKPSTGTHFYTASETEKANVRANLAHLYTYEGPAYNVSADSGGGTKQMVWRFYNRLNGTHFYTADPGERATVEATLGHIYTLDGPAFYLGK
ncbi:MAG: choice-of-anchor X domain-containing protein [Coriobacteriia bacterium]